MKISERSFNREFFSFFFLEMMRETLVEFIFICKKNDVLLLDKKKKKFLFLDRMEFILYAVVN